MIGEFVGYNLYFALWRTIFQILVRQVRQGLNVENWTYHRFVKMVKPNGLIE